MCNICDFWVGLRHLFQVQVNRSFALCVRILRTVSKRIVGLGTRPGSRSELFISVASGKIEQYPTSSEIRLIHLIWVELKKMSSELNWYVLVTNQALSNKAIFGNPTLSSTIEALSSTIEQDNLRRSDFVSFVTRRALSHNKIFGNPTLPENERYWTKQSSEIRRLCAKTSALEQRNLRKSYQFVRSGYWHEEE